MKLIVHVGGGKTGSSSIQSALLGAPGALKAKNMKYLGLMLENGLREKKATWQRRSGSPEFFKEADQDSAIEELKQVLLDEVQLHQKAGLETLVWSNEWIGERGIRVIPALHLVAEQGVDVEIMMYVRRHDKWIVSAYSQWGIKHKTYPGPILKFDDWFKGKGFRYQVILRRWLEAFGDKVTILNYDASGDVVSHFFSKLGLPAVPTRRDNTAPSTDKLAAWAVFNNRFEGTVPEQRFASVLRRLQNRNQNKSSVPAPQDLFPTESNVENIRKEYVDDMAFVNQHLERLGEPLLEMDGPARVPRLPTDWEMNRLLLEMVFTLQERLNKLERDLAEGE